MSHNPIHNTLEAGLLFLGGDKKAFKKLKKENEREKRYRAKRGDEEDVYKKEQPVSVHPNEPRSRIRSSRDFGNLYISMPLRQASNNSGERYTRSDSNLIESRPASLSRASSKSLSEAHRLRSGQLPPSSIHSSSSSNLFNGRLPLYRTVSYRTGHSSSLESGHHRTQHASRSCGRSPRPTHKSSFHNSNSKSDTIPANPITRSNRSPSTHESELVNMWTNVSDGATMRVRTSQAPLGDMTRTFVEGLVLPTDYKPVK